MRSTASSKPKNKKKTNRSAQVYTSNFVNYVFCAFSALTLLVGRQEGHPACNKNLGGLWGWVRRLSGWGGAHPDCRYLCLHYLPLLHKNPEDRRWGNQA